jgi:hypothetical protein
MNKACATESRQIEDNFKSTSVEVDDSGDHFMLCQLLVKAVPGLKLQSDITDILYDP